MTSRFSLFSHFTHPLTEYEADTTPRSWVLNGYGMAEFTSSLAYSPATETNLQFGNLIYIEHIPTKDAAGNTNGKLPAWSGVIVPNRELYTTKIHPTAISLEGLLLYRPLPF